MVSAVFSTLLCIQVCVFYITQLAEATLTMQALFSKSLVYIFQIFIVVCEFLFLKIILCNVWSHSRQL